MTDPGREVTLVAGDTTYTLYAGNRALRMMERETGLALAEAVDALNRGSIEAITVALWALLQRSHPDLTIDAVDDVIDAAGYDAATDAIGGAMEHALPRADADGGDQASGKARRGTGTRSSPARSRPASASPSSGR